MSLHFVDLLIIGVYLVSVVVVGISLARRASQSIDSYFLGANKVPWYVLGVSNASSMFDITGTMWLVSLIFVYGLKGAWIPWLWPVFNQIFLMVYLSAWLRRSNVLTGAEWIGTRFGTSNGAKLSKLSVLVFAIVSVVGFLAYAFQGIGKFASAFFPYDIAPEVYAIIVMGLTTVYVVVGGMYSVVFTDVVQFIIMTIVSIAVAIIAFNAVAPDALAAAVPGGWTEIFFGWELGLDWSDLIPAVNERIASDGWELFSIFIMMVLFKGVLISLAGPAPNYDMQRILAARTAREASLMSAIVSVCQVPRWFMIAGITTLAIVFFREDMLAMGSDIDFELVLPFVIKEFLPVGVVGLLIAGLLAAFMSTFDSTVNAGAAYLVNDLYKEYINKDAPPRTYVLASYVASVIVVIVGVAFGFMSESINSVTQWIVSGLFGGYTAPNVLKWHWWRFNGYGYFGGMVGGLTAALVMPLLAPELSALDAFPLVLLISIVASLAFTLLTEPDDEEALKTFYRRVRPWGFWKPIREKVRAEDPSFVSDATPARDMVNVVVGIVWQTSLVVFPIYFLVYEYRPMLVALAIAATATWFLKKNWYDKMPVDDLVETGGRS